MKGRALGVKFIYATKQNLQKGYPCLLYTIKSNFR